MVSAASPGRQPLHLVVERLLLRQRGPRLGDGVVQRVEPRHHDVLAVLERQRVLLLAIGGHGALGRFHAAALPLELLIQPGDAARQVGAARLGVPLHVVARQLVGGAGGQLRAGRHEPDVHQAAALDRIGRHARQERADERGRILRHAGELGLLGQVERARPCGAPARGRSGCGTASGRTARGRGCSRPLRTPASAVVSSSSISIITRACAR